MTRYWLTQGDGRSYGPYTVEELRRFSAEGRLGSSSMVCREGSAEWVAVTTVIGPLGMPTAAVPPIAPPPVPPGAHGGGYPGQQAVHHPDARSRVAAGVLGILLGALGIHNFYLGNTGIGLLQLLLSILSCGWLAPAVWVWGLIEGILILTGSTKVDGRGIPLRD